jgi:redox-sensing transcriptional repressor
LVEQLQKILHIDREWDLVIVGAGELGGALARYKGFSDRGFRVKMVFDSDPERIGQKVGEITIEDYTHLIEKVKQAGIKIAMIAVPAGEAQEVANTLIEAGVKAILNYAPLSLNVPPEVRVQYIDPSIHLQRMTYYVGQ